MNEGAVTLHDQGLLLLLDYYSVTEISTQCYSNYYAANLAYLHTLWLTGQTHFQQQIY